MYAMPIEMPPGDRKYQTEFTLVITVAGMYLLRAQDLPLVDVADLDASVQCHLYVISRAPRISIDPDTVEIGESVITGEVLIHKEDDAERSAFVLPHQIGPGPLTWRTSWPHEAFEILDSEGTRAQGGVCALLGHYAHVWPAEADRHEILYVGQAFGSAGDRTAWDRLKKHETLQRILADQNPDTQVWLTLAAVSDVQLLQEISPRPGRLTDDEDNEHINQVFKQFHEEGFHERECVALSEAGLIRGWQPEYNDLLKYTFPSRRQVSLENARDLDLHGLVVEWQSLDLPPLYWSSRHNANRVFFLGYEVHLDAERALTLSLSTLHAITRSLPDGD
jgi:hypothetical protein